MESDPASMQDYELLELYLFNSIPRRDVKPLAKTLIDQFGSFAEVITAPRDKLIKVNGISEKTAADLKIILAAAQKLGQQNLINRPVLSSWSELVSYCRMTMQYETKEQFRVLFLDKKNRLIKDEVLGQGTIDRAPVYPREIIKSALTHDSTALILVHNHPSGESSPSQSDIDITRAIVEAASTIGIQVHDHLIVGRNNTSSLKNMGLM